MKLTVRLLIAMVHSIAFAALVASAATHLPLGTATAGAIRSNTQTDRYTFTANAGDVVALTAAVTSGELGPNIRLFTADGTLVASKSSPDCANSTLEMNETTLPPSAGGEYVVEIGNCKSGNSGSYSLFVQKTKNPESALGVLWGEMQNSEINASAYRDTYTFAGTAKDGIDLSVAATGGALGPNIRIYGPDGALLSVKSTDCGGSSLQLSQVSLPVSGNYTVMVSDCAGRNTGSYDLTTRCSGVCLLPSPVVSSISPASLPAGGRAFSLIVKGSNFVKANANSVVQWNGTDLPTTFVNPGMLRVTVPAGFVAKAGTFPITVLTPAAGAGTSEAALFYVNNPQPALKLVSPAKARVGASTTTLVVRGSNFVPGSLVRWNGNALATTYNHAGQLTAIVPAANMATASKATITVSNFAPSGGISATQAFSVENPEPVLTSISPSSTTVGHAALTVTVNGSNFLPVSTIEWNGAGLPTTYVSNSQLQAVIPAGAFSAAGTETVAVLNPAPGGGLSEDRQTFTVGPPATAPVFSLAGGTYHSPQRLLLTDATPGATIYYTYTTNGSMPTMASAKYHGPITIDTTGLVEAIAVAPGFSQSAMSSKAYVYAAQPQTAAPVFSLAGGIYYSPQTLVLTDPTPGATIYYTTNGAAPTTSSAVYSGPITISSTEIVLAIAVAPGHTLSPESAKAYRYDPELVASAPYFSLAGGMYTTAQTLVLTDSTPGATICYTTDGSSPLADDALESGSCKVYTGPITIGESELVQAVAIAKGYHISPVSSKLYTFAAQP